MNDGGPQSTLCFSCHDGTGSNYNVAAEYSDVSIPSGDPATSSFYSHAATTASTHTSGQDDEFAGVFNRHAECGDCHNPHEVNGALMVATSSGWTASGALAGTSGVTGSLIWDNPITYEYELCLKCHSSYTTLRSYTEESYKKTDKAAEFDPTSASYHPVEAPGTNTSAALQNSLDGGSLWQFTTGSTIRCTNCHASYQEVAGSPAPGARLAPHTSQYRSLLIANYRNRDLKTASEAYSSNDFALCYLCHSETPFSQGATQETNFEEHDKHLTEIDDEGDPGLGTNIDTPGAGKGNAICAECHFKIHGTELAYWSTDRGNQRLVNFSPNVQPLSGNLEPLWSLADKNCTLVCHGETHDPEGY